MQEGERLNCFRCPLEGNMLTPISDHRMGAFDIFYSELCCHFE